MYTTQLPPRFSRAAPAFPLEAAILPALRPSPLAAVVLVIVLALLYAGSGVVALSVSIGQNGPSPLWPPAGLALAAVLLFGPRVSPLVVLGWVLLDWAMHRNQLLWLPCAGGSLVEALAGAALLRQVPGFRLDLERLVDVAAFVLLACAGAALPAALVGAGTLASIGQLPPAQVPLGFVVWWAGDAAGCLTVAPLVLLLARVRRPTLQELVEGALLLGLLLATTLVAFGAVAALPVGYHLAYLVFPALLLVVARLGQPGAILGGALVAFVAAWSTARGGGPFAGHDVTRSVLLVQSFTAVAAITGLVLGAAVSERRRAVDLRDEFISTAGHELKTPLTTLALELDALRSHLARGGDGPGVSLVQAMDGQMRRLVRLIEVMLDLSRLSTGRLIVVPETVDLGDLVRQTVARAQADFAASSTPLSVEAPSGIPCLCDPVRLDQVVANLLSNALRYGEGRPVHVEVRRVRRHAEVRVMDEGIGISEADQDRIFERFGRAAPDRAYGGLGLGLYIARQILDAHGGSLAVRSAPGKGATFVVRLPLAVP